MERTREQDTCIRMLEEIESLMATYAIASDESLGRKLRLEFGAKGMTILLALNILRSKE